jgi:hypothetical protein
MRYNVFINSDEDWFYSVEQSHVWTSEISENEMRITVLQYPHKIEAIT